MNRETAKLLLENLIARVVLDPKTGQGTITGILTPMEIDALRIASTLLAESGTGGLPPEFGPEHPAETEPDIKPVILPEADTSTDQKSESDPKIKLNLDSLKIDAPPSNDTRMCLDFGTAMSKAFATIVEEDEIVDYLMLKLGHRASNGKSKTIYPVPSSLWIDNDGKIHLGELAIALSLQADPSDNRQRFDSIKKALIMGMKESTPFQQPINRSINPTDVPFSVGDAIILYLGYLTDLACTELQEEHNCPRYVQRNFALPSWTSERRAWGEEMLREMLIKAQIVADTFHDRWEEGISVNEVKSALGQIDKLDNLPEYLLDKGITEPLAVGSSRLRQEEPSRGLAIVLDVGAGTSDLAMFLVVENPEGNLFNAFPIVGTNQSLHMAGDTLDTAMQQTILEKATIKPHDPDYHYVIQDLRMRVRSLKEDLFRDGYCIMNFVNGDRVRVEKDEFLSQDSVKRFGSSLAEKFTEVIRTMNRGLAQHFGSGGLSVVLTGGGATLPMVKELAKGVVSIHGITFPKDEVPLVPEEFKGEAEFETVYPQLAVAVGGAMPVLIDEKNALDDFDFPTGALTLGRFPISGS